MDAKQERLACRSHCARWARRYRVWNSYPQAWPFNTLTDRARKSQLAIRYAQTIRERSPDTWIFWVHGGTAERFEQGYRDIADAVHLPGRNDPNANILQLVHRWLRNEENGRWLMILDNVDDMAVFYSTQPQLATLLPQSSNGSIVITSRSLDVAQRLTGNFHSCFEILVMSHNQACQLLQQKLGSYDETYAGELARALDYMPLALTQAAAFINRRAPRMTMFKYLREFHENENKKGSLLNIDSGDLRRDPSATNSIVTTWQITFQQIQRERASAADLLSLISFFNPQSIPEWALQESVYTREAARSSFDEDVVVLRGYSLVKMTEDGRAFEMHPLVQYCTQTWLAAMSTSEDWRREFLRAMSRLYPSGEYENWGDCGELEPHIAAIVQERRPEEDGDAEWWAILLHNAAWYRFRRGRYTEAESMLRRAFETILALYGPEDHDTLASMQSLALVCTELGKIDEAEPLMRQNLETSERLLGEEHPHTLRSMHSYAGVLHDLARFDEAEQLFRQSWETSRKVLVLGEDHHLTLACMGGLASALSGQGRHEEAEPLQRQNLERRKTVLGPHHPHTLNSMDNLAFTLDALGKFETAEHLYQQALDLSSRVLGADHSDTLARTYLFAHYLYRRRRLGEAAMYCERALSGSIKVFGPDHPQTRKCKDLDRTLREDIIRENGDDAGMVAAATGKSK